MPSYVVTGVSKGIGWAFLDHLSKDPKNTVIGLVRNVSATKARVATELGGRSNITILEGDLTKYDTLKKAAAETEKVTGGKLDYLIANAGYITTWDKYDGLDVLGPKTEELEHVFHELMHTNVLGNINLYALFMPQILKGTAKKVILISSGMADMEFTRELDLPNGSLYGASKAAANIINAKFSAVYKKDGVLFLSICPGLVDTGVFEDATPEQTEAVQAFVGKFIRYEPTFKGPDPPAESVKAMLSVIERSSVQNRDGGAFVSHFGNRRWL